MLFSITMLVHQKVTHDSSSLVFQVWTRKKIGRSNHLPAKFSPRAAAKEAVAKRSAQSPQCSLQFQWRIISANTQGEEEITHSNQAALTHTMTKISINTPLKQLQDTTRMRLIYPFRRTIRHKIYADKMPCD